MCQQWLSVAGHLFELAGFLLIAFELRHVFAREHRQGNVYVYSVGVVLVAAGMLGQTAGGWVGRLPISGIATCF
jgi:hypothetical protein